MTQVGSLEVPFVYSVIDVCVFIAIIMPDDTAEEKVKAVLAYGAQVEKVRPASIVDKKQVSTRVCCFS